MGAALVHNEGLPRTQSAQCKQKQQLAKNILAQKSFLAFASHSQLTCHPPRGHFLLRCHWPCVSF